MKMPLTTAAMFSVRVDEDPPGTILVVNADFADGLEKKLQEALTKIEALRAAAEDFIAKVDRGEARSVRSYAKFKAALALGGDVNAPSYPDGGVSIDPRFQLASAAHELNGDGQPQTSGAMSIDELMQVIHERLRKCVITQLEHGDGSSHASLTINGVLRATWRGRLVTMPPRDGVTPRGPKEYFNLEFYPAP